MIDNLNLLSRAMINATNELDLQFNIPIGYADTNEVNKLYVKQAQFIQNYAEIMELWTGLPSKTFVQYASNFVGRASIPDNNTLDIAMKIVQPPVFDSVIEVQKDSFTRQSYPTLNYGSRQSLSAGHDYDGEYISYINFDITPYYSLNNMTLRDVYLVMKKSNTVEATLELYECRSDWYEKYITWNTSMPLIKKVTEYTSEYNDSYIIIDLKDIILEKIAIAQPNLSLAIKSDNFIMISSRESGLAPRIMLTYSDPIWNGFLGEVDTFNKAIIRCFDKSDITGAALITKKLHNYCKASIRRPEYLNSRAAIINNQIVSRSYIERSIYSSNKAYINNKKDMESRGYIPASSINSKSNLYSTLHNVGFAVINYDNLNHDQQNKGGIIRNYINAIVQLKEVNTLMSKATIINNQKLDNINMAKITNEFIPSKSIIDFMNHMNGKIDITHTSNLFSTVKITRGDILSNTILHHLLQTEGLGTLKQCLHMPSKASIVKNNINGLVSLRNVSDVTSSGYIIGLDTSEVLSKTSILNSLINGSVTLKKTNDTISMSNIMNLAKKDSESFADVLNFIKNGRAIILRTENTDLASNALLIQYFYSELTSSSDIYRITSTESKAEITYPRLNSEKDGIGYIIRSKIWTPNNGGGLTFEDRRLPKKWN